MIDTVYIENEVLDHPRTKEILSRFPKAVRIPCERYGEVFNRNAQNFRLQKKKPALILAQKFDHFVLEAPAGYGIGSKHNYYFSHMLNCIYDCRYCFLQGMFRSAHLVCFVNYEDFERSISEMIKKHTNPHFFSGYDCDSLALEPVTSFASRILDFFAVHPQALIELRTKSIQVKSLLQRKPMENCVVAFSLNPNDIAQKLEYGAASIAQRLDAMEKLQEQGWKLGLRFDPVINTEDAENQYEELFKEVFRRIKIKNIHSVSLGAFRLPKAMYEQIHHLYPDEKLFAGAMKEKAGMISYPEKFEARFQSIRQKLLTFIPQDIFFPCS